MDHMRLLGIMQTITGKQCKPFTGKQGQKDFDQKN